MKVVILCGGLGTRLREETEFRPKPMVPVGNRPILWHIMHSYSAHGFRRFVLCLGYLGHVIEEYFGDSSTAGGDWEVTLADTGEAAMTGARVARAAEQHLGEAEHFGVTYGDGLTDADLAAELAFHVDQGRTGTILGVNLPSRFGQLILDGDRVLTFTEKPEFRDDWINGGYLFFERGFTNYLSLDDSCVLESDPLVRLAQDAELSVFRHRGFWFAMDTQRDLDQLERIWASGEAPWRR